MEEGGEGCQEGQAGPAGWLSVTAQGCWTTPAGRPRRQCPLARIGTSLVAGAEPGTATVVRREHLCGRLDDSDCGRRAGVWLRIVVGAREPVRNECTGDDHAGREADEGSTRSLLGLDRFHHDHDIIEVNRLEGGSRSVVWLSATTAFAIIGCTWALSIARYGGPDEPAHVIRAAGAAHGDLVGKPVAGFEPGIGRSRSLHRWRPAIPPASATTRRSPRHALSQLAAPPTLRWRHRRVPRRRGTT